jgi:uncharacterized protein
MGAITDDERAAVRNRSPVGGKYDTAINRESAFEVLNKTEQAESASSEKVPAAKTSAAAPAEEPSKLNDFLWGNKRRQGVVESAAKSATRSVATSLLRGLLGGLLGGKRR